MGCRPSLSEFHRELLIEQWRKGATIAFLASENEISTWTVRSYIKKSGKKRFKKRKSKARGMNNVPANDVKAFLSHCRKAIYRSGKKEYEKWERIVKEFETDGGMTHQQACIQASKDFSICRKLFAVYAPAVQEKDPIPDSHPDAYTGQQESEGMVCEDRELSYKENLDWAIEAAGKEKNEGEAPKICPNHTAFYLYREARENSKEFLSRFTQVAGRGTDDAEEQRKVRRGGERNISEILEMLGTLTPEEERKDDEAETETESHKGGSN